MNVIVDNSEDIGRVGFAGLLSDVDRSVPVAAESPEAWAPVARMHGPALAVHRDALELFHRWLEHQHELLAS